MYLLVKYYLGLIPVERFKKLWGDNVHTNIRLS